MSMLDNISSSSSKPKILKNKKNYPNLKPKIKLGQTLQTIHFTAKAKTGKVALAYKAMAGALLLLAFIFAPIVPVVADPVIAYKDGYPTIEGNYVDCNGKIDNDMSHHSTDPADTDPSHHIGQNCPPESLVGIAATSGTVQRLLASTATQMVASAASVEPALSGFSSNVSFGANSYGPGSQGIVNTTVTASQNTGSVLVDTEIYNSSGTKVLQNFVIQNLNANQPSNSSYNFTVPSTPGIYTVKVGVFSTDWSRLYYWNNSAGILVVGSGSQPTPAASPSPTPNVVTQNSTVTSCPGPSTNAFTACYYKDQNFESMGLARTDSEINFDWGNRGPGSGIPTENFSAKWKGNFNFDAGSYVFAATADDGVRVYVDGNLVIDKFIDQPATTYTANVNMTAGSHTVTMDYYENGGSAVAKLSWSKVVLASTPAPAPQPTNTAPSNSGNPLAGLKFYVNPNSNAQNQATQWMATRPQDAQMMLKIAGQPVATWLGGWNSNIQSDTNNIVSTATNNGSTAVLIAYNIPQRDCGGYSAGGSNSPEGYRTWISGLAAGIGNRKAVVVLEPDALAQVTCLSSADQQTRYQLLNYAVTTLKALGQTYVYIDGGHPGWISASDMAGRLNNAGISKADGFSLNVSNFNTTSENTSYGQQISSQVGGKHFIIDTSRNGNGSNGEWCNPSGRALGLPASTNTGNSLLDATLWLKAPGESDGNCSGGPNAGVWWPDYALGLAQRAGW